MTGKKKLSTQKPSASKEALIKKFINGGGDRKPILVRLDPELADRLDAHTEGTGHTRIYHIIKAIEAYLGNL